MIGESKCNDLEFAKSKISQISFKLLHSSPVHFTARTLSFDPHLGERLRSSIHLRQTFDPCQANLRAPCRTSNRASRQSPPR